MPKKTENSLNNHSHLARLIKRGLLGPQFATVLEWIPAPLVTSFERVEGLLLGLAIGDALGNTSEATNAGERQRRYGEIRDYLPNRYAESRSVGLPSDDTQMAYWLIECLLEDDGLVPEHVAHVFGTADRQIFGIGQAVREFVANIGAGVAWEEAGTQSAGNGALMRIAPIVLPHLLAPSPALWVDTILAAHLTHRDPGSTASCVAFVNVLWQALSLTQPPTSDWWLTTFCKVAQQLEGDTHYRPRRAGLRYDGPIWRFAQEHVSDALASNLSVREACDSWYSGAFLLETVPSVLMILAKHGQDPEEAIVRAVNDTRDNDTVAAIVGAAVGALHGADKLPTRWSANLLGRTGPQDDGRIFDLIAQVRERFWSN